MTITQQATDTHRDPETTSDFGSMEPGDLVAFTGGGAVAVLRLEHLESGTVEEPDWFPLAAKPVRRGHLWEFRFHGRRTLEIVALSLVVQRKHG